MIYSASALRQDLELLQTCTNTDEFVWTENETVKTIWQAWLCSDQEKDDCNEPPWSSGAGSVSFKLKLSTFPECWLQLIVRKSSQQGLEASISGPECNRQKVEQLRQLLETRLKEIEEAVEIKCFDCFTTLQNQLSEHPLTFEKQVKEEEEAAISISQTSSIKKQDEKLEQDNLARVIFWTHHLKASSKRKDLASWCEELNLWGIVKLGYPGFLCFEGFESDVSIIIQRIKSLQWHALLVRSHQIWSPKPPPPPTSAANQSVSLKRARALTLLSCPFSKHHPNNQDATVEWMVRTGCQELETMKEIVERLRETGIDETELIKALHLRKNVR